MLTVGSLKLPFTFFGTSENPLAQVLSRQQIGTSGDGSGPLLTTGTT